MKIPNKGELQQSVISHLLDIEFKDFVNLYKKCTTKPYLFLVIKTALTSDNLLRCRRNLLEIYKN